MSVQSKMKTLRATLIKATKRITKYHKNNPIRKACQPQQTNTTTSRKCVQNKHCAAAGAAWSFFPNEERFLSGSTKHRCTFIHDFQMARRSHCGWTNDCDRAQPDGHAEKGPCLRFVPQHERRKSATKPTLRNGH